MELSPGEERLDNSQMDSKRTESDGRLAIQRKLTDMGVQTRAVRRQKKSRQKRRLVQAPQAPFKAPIHSRCCIGGFRETGLALVIVLRCD